MKHAPLVIPPESLTLAIDIGGTGLKACTLDSTGDIVGGPVRVDTPHPCPPEVIIPALVELTQPLRPFARVSVGFPGRVRDGSIFTAPNLGTEAWKNIPLARLLEEALGAPTRVINDADMQGLGARRGVGLELVITLGTGMGSALFLDGERMPHLELGQHPCHEGDTYDQYIGDRALKDIGLKKWNKRVEQVMEQLQVLIGYDTLYLGGGNANETDFSLPADTLIVSNKLGLIGGIRLWDEAAHVA